MKIQVNFEDGVVNYGVSDKLAASLVGKKLRLECRNGAVFYVEVTKRVGDTLKTEFLKDADGYAKNLQEKEVYETFTVEDIVEGE